MTIYTNPIPAAGVNPRKLRQEIFISLDKQNQVMISGSTPTPETWMTSGDTLVDVPTGLTAGEQTSLTAIVAAHTPGTWTAFPTVEQMALEPGLTGQQMYVSDLHVTGGYMFYNGSEWQPVYRMPIVKWVTSTQSGIDTTLTNITGLSSSIGPGSYNVTLNLLYQGSATSASPKLDWGPITNSAVTLEWRVYRQASGTSQSGTSFPWAGYDDEEIDLTSTGSLSAATTTYLIRCEMTVHVTATSTLQPRIGSVSGTGGTISIMPGSNMTIRKDAND